LNWVAIFNVVALIKFACQLLNVQNLIFHFKFYYILYNNKLFIYLAHCCFLFILFFSHIFRMAASELGVSVGSHQLNAMDADQEDIAVKTVILHESYDSWTIQNDICLLELDTEATFGEHVGAIDLPSQGEEYDSGTTCTVTGWGATTEGGYLADVLQKVTHPLYFRTIYFFNNIFIKYL
jgi:hypothetical protein